MMRTTKQTVIELEDGDVIRIKAGSTSFVVFYEEGERGLVIDDVPQVQHINAFRTSALHADDLEECVIAHEDGTQHLDGSSVLVPAQYHRCSIFLTN